MQNSPSMNQKILKIVLPLLVIVAFGFAMTIRWWLNSKGREDVMQLLAKAPVKHLAIIMDGNRRWARQHGYKPWIGHQHGVEPLRIVVRFCLQYQIPYLTLYVFSLENFKRSAEEKEFLFDVLAQDTAQKTLAELAENNVCIRFAGDRTKFPEKLRSLIQDIEEKTALNTTLTLTLLFCYGGRQELVDAARAVCKDIIMQGEPLTAITAARLEKHLWTSGLPDVDLTIRTGYCQRLSNFLPYQTAYSDFYYPPCLWPDFREQHLVEALRHHAATAHNVGA